jgi:hypothetical protein
VIHFPKSNLAEREKEEKFLHRQNHRHPIHPFFPLLPCVCVYWKYVQEEEEEKKGVIPIVYNRNSRERERDHSGEEGMPHLSTTIQLAPYRALKVRSFFLFFVEKF